LHPFRVKDRFGDRTALLVVFSLLVVVGNSCASSETRTADFQASKLEPSLVDLYDEYRRYKESDTTGSPFQPRQSGIRVVDEHVEIDAVAASDAQILRRELEAIGAKQLAQYGLYVSCKLPISEIARLGRLSALKFARPAISTTDN